MKLFPYMVFRPQKPPSPKDRRRVRKTPSPPKEKITRYRIKCENPALFSNIQDVSVNIMLLTFVYKRQNVH